MSDYLTNRTRPLSDAERKIVEDNQGLVGHCIKLRFRKYIGRPKSRGDGFISFEELRAAGRFGLIEALDHWDASRGAFTTCANVWIRNKISRWLKEHAFRNIRVPKWLVQKKRMDHETIDADLRNGRISDAEAEKRHADRRRLDRAADAKPINDAVDAYTNPKLPHDPRRKMLLRLIYSVDLSTEEERLGRVVALKLAGMDGGSPAANKIEESLASIGEGLGATAAEAGRAYRAFLSAASRKVGDLGMEYPT